MTFQSNAQIHQFISGAYFHDTFTTYIQNHNQSAMDVYIELMSKSPQWVNALMDLRNRIVGVFGLKNLGKMRELQSDKKAADYRVGDRVGIFTLHSVNRQEVILKDNDKHLNVKVSFYLEDLGDRIQVHATTVVHVHNNLGRLYMLFVTPAHKIIVPSSLKTLTS
ncbi:DUF2867 domain-containing protein [Vibrio penaeicida]|uniref:DUF2867 domain-containing protein n=1 Tax=Vibrio penaeicida TaxID=104609 RepID=A0AAV5NMW0_9VIBR|nr:DUF2867 domain-containing protein [Vibrio penaeicida]RTZ19479.1 DUF2867 domain-containing protein [Vibrio penaeicida]GLQ71848.1 hypothetical protein GCM10007932_12080 [Vibrio penaeicida]